MAAIRTAGFSVASSRMASRQPATECASHSVNIYREIFENGIRFSISGSATCPSSSILPALAGDENGGSPGQYSNASPPQG